MLNLGIIVLTYNNEAHIKDTLNSIIGLGVDCHIIDSGSIDKTIEFSSPLVKTITINKLETWDAGLQRNFAYEKFKNYYTHILFLDSDEKFNNDLYEEIISFDGSFGAIRSLYFLFGKPLKYISKNTYHDRLVETSFSGKLFTSSPGEVFTVERTKIIPLKSTYRHDVDAKGLKDWLIRIFKYSFQNGIHDCNGWINQRKRKSKNYSSIRHYRFLFGPFLPVLYLSYYIFYRKGYKDGLVGILFSIIMSSAYISYPFGFLINFIKYCVKK